MFLKMNTKRGFTLIELLTVIAILGILVLLAAPRFLGYAEQAQLAQIKNDVKAHETTIEAKLTSDSSYQKEIDKWNQIGKEEVDKAFDEKRMFDKKGLVTSVAGFSCNGNGEGNDDDYIIHTIVNKSSGLSLVTASIGNLPSDSKSDCYEIPKKYINSKLSGKFIYGEGGVFYIHNKPANTIVDEDGSNDENSFGEILSCNGDEWRNKANPASDFYGYGLTREALDAQAAEFGMTIEQLLMAQGFTEEEANMQIEAMVDKYTITNYVGSSKNVVIPCEINGMPVSSIEGLQGENGAFIRGAFQGLQIESVVFPSTLKNIGIQAFDDNQIKEIKLPDNVFNVSFASFRKNPIEKLDLGNGVMMIGTSAFDARHVATENPLKELTLPASLQVIEHNNTFQLPGLKIVNNYSNLDVSSYFEHNTSIEIINH